MSVAPNQNSQGSQKNQSGESSESPASLAFLLNPSSDAADSGSAVAVRAFGLSPIDRLTRSLARTGIDQVQFLASDGPTGPLAEAGSPGEGRCVVFRSDYFYDERLVAALIASEDTVLCTATSEGHPGEALAANVRDSQLAEVVALLRAQGDGAAGCEGELQLRRAVPTDLVPAYNAQLRKHDPPYVYPARPDIVRETENRIFAASYKGITDFITKHVFPLPARAVVRVLAKRGVRPNSVTAIGYLLTGMVLWLFAEGYFGIGLVCCWLMTFLDTVDGKLARVTLTSSKLGGALDHGLDLVHPPFWWWAWAVGLGLSSGLDGFAGLGDNPSLAIGMWIIVYGYVVGRILEGVFLALFGMEIFTWRRFDSWFRGVISRRNPNLLFLSIGLAAGRPDLAFTAVAVWTVACIFIVIARIAMAISQKRRGGAIRPWHEEQSA